MSIPTDPVAHCELLIDRARSGRASDVESEGRIWLAAAVAAGDRRSAGLASHVIGTALLLQSRPSEAITVLVDTATAAREAGDHDRYVRSLVQSASALADMGGHHRALELVSDATRLMDDRVGPRVRYTSLTVRSRIALAYRDYTQALAYLEEAQAHADRDGGVISGLTNRRQIAEVRFAQAMDLTCPDDPTRSAALARVREEMQRTADDAERDDVDRVTEGCRAVIAWIAVWQGDMATAREVLAEHRLHVRRPGSHYSFRIRCAEAALAIAETGTEPPAFVEMGPSPTRQEGLGPITEQLTWVRLVADVALERGHTDVAARNYRRTLALQDQLATQVGAALATVVSLRDDLDLLRKTTDAALAELRAERSGRQSLEARVRELQHEAIADPLTGLINRRGLDLQLDAWLQSAPEAPLALAFVDVDHFKTINDHHGHAAGDRLLVRVAEAMQGAVREGDLVARFAGDEFIIAFPYAALDTANAACGRLVDRLRHAAETTDIRISVSIGIAARRTGEPIASLRERADAALYRAKEAGRGRVMMAN